MKVCQRAHLRSQSLILSIMTTHFEHCVKQSKNTNMQAGKACESTIISHQPLPIDNGSSFKGSVITKKTNVQEISRHRYLITKQTEVHALTQLGPSEGGTDIEKETKAKRLLKQLESEKQLIKQKAKNIFLARMVKMAQELQVQYKVNDRNTR